MPELTEQEYFAGLLFLQLCEKAGSIDTFFDSIRSGERTFVVDSLNLTLDSSTPVDVLQKWVDIIYAISDVSYQRESGLSASEIRKQFATTFMYS